MVDPDSTKADQPVTTIPLSSINLSARRQPRRYFDPDKMAQLVASVKEHGILEPVLVRPLKNGQYELIAGERRVRAAKESGLMDIPAVSRDFSDQEAIQVSLIENLQRDDLNPVEETEAILELLSVTLGLTSSEVKSIIYQAANAKNRGQELKENVFFYLEQIDAYLKVIGRFSIDSFRTSRLPLLNLPASLLEVLREGKLEYTKARTLARIKDERMRDKLLQKAIDQSLSLNEIRSEIKSLSSDPEETVDQALVDRLSRIMKQLKQGNGLNHNSKREQITKLLDQLEELVA
ncbi:MAG TPA: ParB/RepB/Spo0J family partition protein [Leptolyngbyaceae cyanobacterium M33_DOE_097]|nr:ParB/RepB/Spo0J family partition protein [Leptolyngbyaceae cyanobacterium M33_DOE_097]